jgi:hypothetical protein
LNALGNPPLVSVVTPCFNSASTIEQCIDSVLSQTHIPVEHVVIDAGSTDGTVELLREHPHLRWISEPDEGQSDALNKGMDIASGSVLTWLNADDLLEADAAERAVRRLSKAGADRAVVYRDLRVVEDGATSIWRPARTITTDALLCGAFIPQPGSFLTRAAWDSVGGVATDLHLAMDFDLWLRLQRTGTTFLHEAGVGASFTITGDSKTGSRPRSEFIEEEARSMARLGLDDGVVVASGRTAFLEGRPPSADPRAAAGFALERLRTERATGTALTRAAAALAPSLWRTPMTRRHLVREIASRRG